MSSLKNTLPLLYLDTNSNLVKKVSLFDSYEHSMIMGDYKLHIKHMDFKYREDNGRLHFLNVIVPSRIDYKNNRIMTLRKATHLRLTYLARHNTSLSVAQEHLINLMMMV